MIFKIVLSQSVNTIDLMVYDELLKSTNCETNQRLIIDNLDATFKYGNQDERSLKSVIMSLSFIFAKNGKDTFTKHLFYALENQELKRIVFGYILPALHDENKILDEENKLLDWETNF